MRSYPPLHENDEHTQNKKNKGGISEIVSYYKFMNFHCFYSLSSLFSECESVLRITKQTVR